MAQTTVALYSRVSTKDGRQDVENQLRQLRDFATKMGWIVTHEYIDRCSGGKADRQQFKDMFAAASRHEFDVLLFWSLDRLSREGVLETLNYLQRLTSYNVAYRSFTEMYLDSLGPFKDGVLAILACIAKQERIRLSERTVAGLERARAAGRVGGRPRVVRDSAEIRKLRAEGVSLGDIAKTLGMSKTSIHRVCTSLD